MKFGACRVAMGALVALLSISAVAELKVAWLSPSRALLDSTEAQEWQKSLEVELKGEQDRLNALNDAITELRNLAVTDNEIMSADEKRGTASKIESLQLDLDFGLQKLQKLVGDRQQEFESALRPRLQAVVNDVIEIEGYDAIFDLDFIPNSGGKSNTIYVNPKHDITRKVTELLNEKGQE